jgi:hypothetical protein
VSDFGVRSSPRSTAAMPTAASPTASPRCAMRAGGSDTSTLGEDRHQGVVFESHRLAVCPSPEAPRTAIPNKNVEKREQRDVIADYDSAAIDSRTRLRRPMNRLTRSTVRITDYWTRRCKATTSCFSFKSALKINPRCEAIAPLLLSHYISSGSELCPETTVQPTLRGNQNVRGM